MNCLKKNSFEYTELIEIELFLTIKMCTYGKLNWFKNCLFV